MGAIVQKYTPKYTANAQKNIPKTIAAPPGARQGDAFGPQAPIRGGYGFGYIFLCIFCIFWRIFLDYWAYCQLPIGPIDQLAKFWANYELTMS